MMRTEKTRTTHYKSEERYDFQVRQRNWRESTPDGLQIGGLVHSELLAPKAILVKALKEIVVSVPIKDGLQPDAGSAKGSESSFTQTQEDKTAKESQDIFIYGSDSNRIQTVLNASLEAAKATTLPRITLKGATMQKTITFAGLRTILEGKYRVLNQPEFVFVVLENYCEDMMLKFEMSGFREHLSGRGVNIAVLLWSCVEHGQLIDSTLLSPFTTKLFIPSSKAEKPWLDEGGTCKMDGSVRNHVAEHQSAEKTLTITHGFGVNPYKFSTEVTTKPGPTRATTVVVGQSNDVQSVAVSKNGTATTPGLSLPSYKSLQCETISFTNNAVEDPQPQPIVQQPRSLLLEAQTMTNPKAMENGLEKQWGMEDEEDMERRGFGAKFGDCCVDMLECL